MFQFITLTGFGQITLSENQLNFSATNYKQTTTKSFDITNDYSYEVGVVIRSSNSDFTVDDSIQTVPGKSKITVDVDFTPRHNIKYNEEIVVVTKSIDGSFSVDVQGDGKYDAYYSSSFDLSEQQLKDALKSIISKNYVNLGYNGARDKMYGSIDNHGGKVECVYTGRTATFNTRSGANSNSFNCEHTWPQSLFNQNEPERADIHHLFPTDVTANGKRGNYPFGEVSSSTWSEGGSKLGSGIFEPRDVHKGDVARALFYFAIRYQNYSNFLTSQESILREWSMDHMPTQMSRDRNDAIYAVQKNRNPFVDYPEFLERITSISSNSVAPVTKSIKPSVSEIKIDETKVTADFTYQLVLTNTGNTAVVVTSISVSNSNLQIGTTSFTIQPGESKTVSIAVKNSGSKINDVVTIQSSAGNLSIPFQLGSFVGLQYLKNSNIGIQYLNDVLQITNANGYRVSIIDGIGREVRFNDIPSDFTELKLNNLTSGVYFVNVFKPSGQHRVGKILVP